MKLSSELSEKVSSNGTYQLLAERSARQFDSRANRFHRQIDVQVDNAAVAPADQLRCVQVETANAAQALHPRQPVRKDFRRIAGIQNWNLVVFPAVHDCFAPLVRDYQSGNTGTRICESFHAKFADQRFANSACSYRPETARQVRTSPLQGIDQSGALT